MAEISADQWQNEWHDGLIRRIQKALSAYERELDVAISMGTLQGPDIQVKHRSTGRKVLIEVQMHPSGSGFPASLRRWAQRHESSDVLATCIVCPSALRATMRNRVLQEPAFRETSNVYFFGDDQIEQLCSTVFTLMKFSEVKA